MNKAATTVPTQPPLPSIVMTVAETYAIPVVTTIAELRSLRRSFAAETVGFVPTMGYLHEGHMSLIHRSLQQNDHTIISIFVNPSQFAPNEDLDTYPRDLDHDIHVITDYLREIGSEKNVDAIFKPEVAEMYPSGFTMDASKQRGAFVEVLGVSNPLEGRARPSFFRGVATVVTKLLNAVNPTTAYFGQKDIQQTVVVKTMVRDLLMGVNVDIVPTVRNQTGLALSSRNKYLSPEVLSQVTCLYKSMQLAREAYNKSTTNVEKLTQIVTDKIISTNSKFRIDYVSFNDPETLDYLSEINPARGCILSMAVYVPNSLDPQETLETRLIDNMIFESLTA
jgi:pantoate--beta-alanine ligase